jgi:DNA-binding Lrp family transcriptional regulator
MMVVEEDRANAILRTLSDEYMRKILVSTSLSAKSIEDISRENAIPVSTCYRRVRELLDLHLLKLERIVLTDAGKKYETFRSRLNDVTISFSSLGELVVNVTPTPRPPEEKLHNLWLSMKGNKLEKEPLSPSSTP